MIQAQQRPVSQLQALFCACTLVQWRLCVGGLVPAGFLYLRFTNLRAAATHSLGNERGSSHFDMGVSIMCAIKTSANRGRFNGVKGGAL
ncbi:hypothetical protein EMIT0324P_11783 [Pseudomonas chlororaphis]